MKTTRTQVTRMVHMALASIDEAVEERDSRKLDHAAWLVSRIPARLTIRAEMDQEIERARALV